MAKLLSLLCVVLGSAPLFGASTLINGAGATFPYPLYSKWFAVYAKANPDTQINYQSIGSGGGIRQFLAKTVDFGATDAPMSNEEMTKAKVSILHLPMALGAVVITYNLPSVKGELHLTSELVADIFLGKIKKWNDERIMKENPKLPLTGDILVAHRTDGSGTTSIFTEYLSKTNAEWKTKVGQGTSVNWPQGVGLGGKGNEGVTAIIKGSPGAIGYTELIYAKNNGLPYASLKNAAGKFVAPSLESVTAAASSTTIPADFRASLTDAKGKESYPISGFTYLLIYENISDAEKGPKLVKFLQWAMKEGQPMAQELFYSPLPKTLIPKVEAVIKKIKTGAAANDTVKG